MENCTDANNKRREEALLSSNKRGDEILAASKKILKEISAVIFKGSYGGSVKTYKRRKLVALKTKRDDEILAATNECEKEKSSAIDQRDKEQTLMTDLTLNIIKLLQIIWFFIYLLQ